MNKVKNFIKKYKMYVLIVVFVVFVALIVNLPSLAKYKNSNAIYTLTSWDGTVATNYQKGDGTENNPFIISNGSEFAFFVEQLKNTDYANNYFELSNDIVINPGVFNYNETNGLIYILDGIEYYVKENTNEYYDNKEFNGEAVGKLNSLTMIENFKGNLNGKSFTIFGFYMNNTINDNLAMFKNLSANLSDLNITNSVVYGKNKVAGIAINSENSKLTNIVYDGFVVNKSLSNFIEKEVEEINITGTMVETVTSTILPPVAIDGLIKSIKLTGKYEVSNIESVNTIKINGFDISQTDTFELNLETNLLTEIQISVLTTIDNVEISFKDLKYTVEYVDDLSSGIIAIDKNSIIKNTINKSDVYGNYITSGIIANVQGTLDLTRCYNKGNIKTNNISSGILGIMKNNSNNVNIKNVYNNGIVNSNEHITSSGIIAILENNTGNINIQNTINKSENYFMNTIINSIVNVTNCYTFNQLTVGNGIVSGQINQTSLESFNTPETLGMLS